MRRWSGDDETAAAFNLGKAPATAGLSLPQGSWRRILDSAEAQWDGPGSQVPSVLASDGKAQLTLRPLSFVHLARDKET
jgi:maltooligosyltrehalose trehalohydrolase